MQQFTLIVYKTHKIDFNIFFSLSSALEKVDLLVHIQKIQLELDRCNEKVQESSNLCEILQTKGNQQQIAIETFKTELERKEMECKKWVSKIQQADELATDLEEKEKNIADLKAALDFEKEKRLSVEHMFQNITEREKELKEKIRRVEEINKNQSELATDLEEKENKIVDLNAALEFEKEKRLDIEVAFQSITEREKELWKKIRTMEEANKNKDEHKNLSNKIQQTDQQANNNKENEKIISDLNAALNFEKEKSLNIEQALQSVTEHEKELKEKIRTMEETSKNKLEEEEYALEQKEKEIAELTSNLEYEKDKRKHIERMFQDLTERENDLQKKVKASEEKSKVRLLTSIFIIIHCWCSTEFCNSR